VGWLAKRVGEPVAIVASRIATLLQRLRSFLMTAARVGLGQYKAFCARRARRTALLRRIAARFTQLLPGVALPEYNGPMADDERQTNPSKTVVTAKSIAPKRAQTREACLVVIYGDDLGRRVPLGRAPTVFGRSSKCEVQIDQESVSRNHAQVSFDSKTYTIRDLGSTNGTYVNDEIIQEIDLRDGDQVKIGRTIFKFISGDNIEAAYHEEIYRLMTVDGLTEVHNKRYFQEALEKEASRSRRYDRNFAVIVFDIDHFKQINDTYGHLAGDAVLRQLGTLVRGRVRRDDILARIGGEEFAVVLPEINKEGAVELARKLLDLVERTPFKFENTQIKVTISLGVAEWESSVATAADLLKLADGKLYEAKRSGRNQVCS
jgi:two-component system, cell cycle response regulator